jgi:hypothetical protein
MAARILSLSVLLCLLSLSTLGFSSDLVRRHEAEPFKLAEIIIDPGNTGREISFYVSDLLSDLDSGTKHLGCGCIFSVPEITNSGNGNKSPAYTVPWPVGDHIACTIPSYTVSFINLGPSRFALILYHSVVYEGQSTATLRYLSVGLPDIDSWQPAAGSSTGVKYDIDITGFTVDERPAPEGYTGESYPKVSP